MHTSKMIHRIFGIKSNFKTAILILKNLNVRVRDKERIFNKLKAISKFEFYIAF